MDILKQFLIKLLNEYKNENKLTIGHLSKIFGHFLFRLHPTEIIREIFYEKCKLKFKIVFHCLLYEIDDDYDGINEMKSNNLRDRLINNKVRKVS